MDLVDPGLIQRNHAIKPLILIRPKMIVMMKLYLPSPDIPIDKAVQAFKNKGLNATGMVYLPGM
jgi:hypothetical protein